MNFNINFENEYFFRNFNPLSANPTKWSNTLKQFVRKLPTICLSVFDHFVGLTLKGSSLIPSIEKIKHSRQ